MTEQFKSSLFGFSKQDVQKYIAELNDSFSKKMLERDNESRAAIQNLRDENERLRRDNERLRSERQRVASALIDAKSFASELIEQANIQDREQRAKNEALRQTELQCLQEFADHIYKLREEIRSTLTKVDEEMDRYTASCETLMRTMPQTEDLVNKDTEEQNEEQDV